MNLPRIYIFYVLYRVCVNTHYKLCELLMVTKMVKFRIGTHIRKHTASPLQTKYHRIIC